MEQRTLVAAYKFYCDKDLTNAHSAAADTEATYEVLKAQLDKYPELENDTKFLAEFSSRRKFADYAGFISYNKQGEEVFSFGKHKNKLLDFDEIEHPIVREAMRLLEIDFPCEVTTFADIPVKSGLGSSSSFAVGLLNALYALKGEMVNKKTLAEQAAKIEVDILKRNMGKQDHYAATYGGLNIFTFCPDETVEVYPVIKNHQPLKIFETQHNLSLIFLIRIQKNPR